MPATKVVLRPNDRFLSVRDDSGIHWELTYRWDDGALWGFEVGSESGESELLVDHGAGAIVHGTHNVPRGIRDRLLSLLSTSFSPINSEDRSFLDALATRFPTESTPSGKRVRRDLSLDRDDTDRMAGRLAPRYIDVGRQGESGEFFALRFAGILRTGRAAEFSTFVERALQLMSDRFLADPDVEAVFWDDLLRVADVQDQTIARRYLELAGLRAIHNPLRPQHFRSPEAMTDGWIFPPDVEELAPIRTFDAFVTSMLSGPRSVFSPTAPVVAGAQTPTAASNAGRPEKVRPTRSAVVPTAVSRPIAKAGKSGAYETAFREYSRVKQLGEGGNGFVELVKDENEKKYALKRLKTKGLTTEKRKRFANEVSVAHGLRHPNIVAVLDHGFRGDGDERELFYVMPLYPAILRERMGDVQSGQILKISVGLARALAYAHEQGVWHRDLKPENIALDADGSAVLLDFGIAHMTDELKNTSIETKPSARMGNYTYAAPEQRGRRDCDHRVDIYVFGLILNEMFTGEVPEGKGHKLIAAESPEHAELDALVDAMLQTDPSERPTAREVLAELVRCGAEPGPVPSVGRTARSRWAEKRSKAQSLLFLVFSAEGSSRSYAAKWVYTGPDPELREGAVYRLPGLDRDFVVRRVRRTENGAELWSERLVLPDADSLPDLELRASLLESGWEVSHGGEVDEPE